MFLQPTIEFKDDLKLIQKDLGESGLRISDWAAQAMYTAYSEDCWCAGWIVPYSRHREQFLSWVTG